MRSVVEVGASVPAFLGKLWKLVNDSETNHLISWSAGGNTFIIKNQAEFAKHLLPLYYKHNNMASFIRQLNMYGFHKISSIDNGGLRFDKDEIEFSHSYFMKGQSYLLEHIKRKPTNSKSIVSSTVDGETVLLKPELMSKVLSDVKQMKGKQENLDAKFSAIKLENEALWREVAILRQKHIKQQQIVNNLIQFLMSLVQPSRSNNPNTNGVGVKRPYQLMINNEAHNSLTKTGQRKLKTLKLSNDDNLFLEELHEDNTDGGTTIHELTHDDILQVDSNMEGLSPGQFIAVELSPGQTTPSPGDPLMQAEYQDTDDLDFQVPNVQMVDSLPIISSPLPEGTTTSLPDLKEVSNPTVITINSDLLSNTTPIPSTSSKNKSALVTPAASKKFNYDNFNILSSTADLKLPANIFASDDSIDPGINLQNILEENIVAEPVATIKQDKMVGGIKLEKPGKVKHSKKKNKTHKEAANVTPVPQIKTEVVDDIDWNNMTLATLDDNNRCHTMNDIDDQLGTMQTDLDSLRELLQSESYSLDTNTLLGLFGTDDPMSYYNMYNDRTKSSNNEDGTNQVMSYTGNVPDFGDISLPDLDGDNSRGACPSPGIESTLNTPQVVLNSPFPTSKP